MGRIMNLRKSYRKKSGQIDRDTGIRTAILVDGEFFLKRYRKVYESPYDPTTIANKFYTMVHAHVEEKSLYRILYYDCYPFEKKILNPITNKNINFKTTEQALFKYQFFEELKRKRKVALRLGELHDGRKWSIKPHVMAQLIKGVRTFEELTEDDYYYDLKQKGVDIMIGVDIASLAYKRLVQQIVLVSGDSDFVPAAKVARREGIDFVLDPMFNHIQPSLFEHIDGLHSTCPKPKHWE